MSRSTLGLILVAVIAVPLAIGAVNNYLDQRERAAQAAQWEKRQAEERAQRAKEWSEAGTTISADLAKALAEARGKDAETAFERYRDVANGALDKYAQPIQVAVAVEALKEIPKDHAIAREGALSELVRLDPDNPRWRRDFAQAKRDADAQRRRQVEEEKRAERQILAQRRREGVSIGMTQDRVLQSSWGRPERVNRSDYSFGTREQWVYGNGNYLYFENGTLTSISTRQ